MKAWREVVSCIEANDVEALAELLSALDEVGRKAVAAQLPGYLTARLGESWDAGWRVREQAAGLRLAGAACLGGAAQVATWLNRRELREVNDSHVDAERILTALRGRSDKWREDLAVRLVERLRPPRDVGGWRMMDGLTGWDLAASLVVETGVEPPTTDAFVAGWAWYLAIGSRVGKRRRPLHDDPLLDTMFPLLFSAEGVAAALAWGSGAVIADLVLLTETDRVKPREIIDGCVSRFLIGGDLAPFVKMWRLLAPEPSEIPVRDFVRLLPSAPAVFVQLAVEELRRVQPFDDALFAEAVQALAFREEKKFVTAALRWIAEETTPERADGALEALAVVFAQSTPALRDRAVRQAVKLAPHAGPVGRQAVREAAAALPAEVRERLAVAFGAIGGAEAAPVQLAATTLAPLPPPIASVDELADELGALRYDGDPAQQERVLAAFVAFTHRDRAAVVEALQVWRSTAWPESFDPGQYAYSHAGGYPISGLYRCGLAAVAPAESRRLGARRGKTDAGAVLQDFVLQRFREVVKLLESNDTLPVLLATPTSPTGHVDPDMLLSRMALLGGAEPLPADFLQALLRLPRAVDPALAVRAEGLKTRAGKQLAAWVRNRPEPTVTYTMEEVKLWRGYVSEDPLIDLRARATPPDGVPDLLRELWTVEPKSSHCYDVSWWPAVMPSHPEVVAAHILRYLPALGAEPAALAHGDGPVGGAVAGVLLHGMSHDKAVDRTYALDGLLTLAARGELHADFGWVLGQLVIGDAVKLNRVTGVLVDALASGAHAQLWPVLATALPALLPAPGDKPRAGLGDLLTVAADAATLSGGTGDIPGLDHVAARKGTSRVVEEARRLHRHLTTGTSG